MWELLLPLWGGQLWSLQDDGCKAMTNNIRDVSCLWGQDVRGTTYRCRARLGGPQPVLLPHCQAAGFRHSFVSMLGRITWMFVGAAAAALIGVSYGAYKVMAARQ